MGLIMSKILEKIQEEWEKDAPIRKDRLDTESLDTPKLFNKYYKMLSRYRIKFKEYKNSMNQARFQKWRYYGKKGDPEDYAKKDDPLLDEKIMKSDIDRYIEGDDEFNKMKNNLIQLEEIVNYLTDVIHQINNRNWHIRNAIEFQKFTHGDN